MIIDFHTHIFPPEVREQRDEYRRRDPTFAEMYGNPKAKIATAEELLASMDEAGVGVSVALGFAWRDQELIVRHNDYLLESAANSGGRIVPFCTSTMAGNEQDCEQEIARCLAAGARGVGELRPESQGWDLNGAAGDRLAALGKEHNLLLLFHVSEPVGHEYPGKEGLRIGAFYRFVVQHPELCVVGAHLAGGLPFYAHTPRVEEVLSRIYVDTAAQSFLYRPEVYESLARHISAGRILMGSDYPLVPVARHMAEIRQAVPDPEARAALLGGNAARLLGLSQ